MLHCLVASICSDCSWLHVDDQAVQGQLHAYSRFDVDHLTLPSEGTAPLLGPVPRPSRFTIRLYTNLACHYTTAVPFSKAQHVHIPRKQTKENNVIHVNFGCSASCTSSASDHKNRLILVRRWSKIRVQGDSIPRTRRDRREYRSSAVQRAGAGLIPCTGGESSERWIS